MSLWRGTWLLAGVILGVGTLGPGCELAKPDAQAAPAVKHCDLEALRGLARGGAREQAALDGELVARAVGRACSELLPPSLSASLQEAGPGRVAADTRRTLDPERRALEERACPGVAGILEERQGLPEHMRRDMFFARCKLARHQVVASARELPRGGSMMPWSVHTLLLEQQLETDVLRPITAALLAYERERSAALKTSGEQKLPVVASAPDFHSQTLQLHVDMKEIRLDYQQLVELVAGRGVVSGGDLAGGIVPAVFEHLAKAMQEQVEGGIAHTAHVSDKLVFVVDAQVPVRTLERLMHTAAQAEFSDFRLAVELGPWVYGALPLSGSTQATGPRRPGKSDHQLYLHVQENGYRVAVHPLSDHVEDPPPSILLKREDAPLGELDRWDLEALEAYAKQHAEAYPGRRRVLVHADASVPVGALAEALAAVRGSGCGSTGSPGCYYPEAVFNISPDVLSGEYPWGSLREGGRGFQRVAGGAISPYARHGRDPSAQGARARVKQGRHSVRGDMDRDIVRRIVRAHINEVRACYDTSLFSDPKRAGEIEVSFVITPEGGVVETLVENNDVGDAELGTCLQSAVERWRFPKPRDAKRVKVSYPFTFSPG